MEVLGNFYFYFGNTLICDVFILSGKKKKMIILVMKRKKKVGYFMCVGKLWMIKHVIWGFGWSICAIEE